MKPFRWIYFSAVTLALSGCFKAGVDTTRFYVLAPYEVQAKLPQDAVKHIAFSSLELPEVLNNSKIASRFGPTGIYYEPEHRWAASLRSLVYGALEGHLRRQGCLCIDSVDLASYQLSVDIKRFEAGPEDEVVLVAQWTVVYAGREHHYEATLMAPYTLKSYDYPALTQAMASTLKALSQRIAQSL